MKLQLAGRLEALRTSYWFVPALLLAAAFGLATLMVRLDSALGGSAADELPWVYTGDADGARDVLATTAGSMITVAGVVFSMTIVALTLASQQFGSRVLRRFMRDTGTQVALGVFVSTFLYGLVVLKAVRGPGPGEFVPHLAVTLAIVLAIASLGVLVFFIHHVARSMQAPVIVAGAAEDLSRSIAALFPERLGEATPGPEPPDGAAVPGPEARPLRAEEGGYVQHVDEERLLGAAVEHDLVLRLLRRPGDFVVQGEVLLLARGPWSPEAERALRDGVDLGPQRTMLQNVEYAFDQLVQILLRALSSSLNDLATATGCIDRLEEAFCQLACRRIPSPYRREAGGALRVVAPSANLPDLLRAVMDQVRPLAAVRVSTALRLLAMLRTVHEAALRAGDRDALLGEAERLREAAGGSLGPSDARRVSEAWAAFASHPARPPAAAGSARGGTQ